MASGLASCGMRPVFELQFIDFACTAWNQIVTNLSTLRWRTNGQWTSPCVIYAPYGGYLPGGAIWHSQANESALAHFPGLCIAMPSTPADAPASTKNASPPFRDVRLNSEKKCLNSVVSCLYG